MDSNFPILVVDDDRISRAIVEKQLNHAGFDVCCAANGKEAIALFKERFFPIILTDWMMPEISGPELCGLIREKITDGYVFIILTTSRDSKSDIVSGLESGADDYLIKPIDPAELMARIKTGIRFLKLEQSLKSANHEIRMLSITDYLTGCYNRSYLTDSFKRELNRARRYRHCLSVVMTDIDFFKKINDLHGHQAGDKVLKRFSACFINHMRQGVDWVVRYGGEEFLVVLPETTLAGAKSFSERLRQLVAELRIQYNNKEISLTASFGGATVDFASRLNQAITVEALINSADEQLYLSKEQGRNRVNATMVAKT